jgi:hypothetical protein
MSERFAFAVVMIFAVVTFVGLLISLWRKK